jgi:hypothetical protein
VKKIIFPSCAIIVLLFSCSLVPSPTHPNASSIEWLENSELKDLFLQLGSMDPNLALEVGRLPEFQEKTGESQILALSRFINLLSNASEMEKANLAKFLEIGRPNVRKYCTPLQAIFWILEKKVDQNILSYSLVELLDKAWDFADSRWEDFDTVTDRLCAPRLVNYYEKKRFRYGLRSEHYGDPKWLFQTNVGMCDEITLFTIICLRKGGYQAADQDLGGFYGDVHRFHHVAVFKGKSGTLYVMDNGRVCKKGVVKLSEYLHTII